jgi:fructokinase
MSAESRNDLYGGIELGGTKTVCVVARGPGEVLAEVRFPTTTPEETLGQAVAFLREQPPVAGVGIGAFGPVDLHPSSSTYGWITSTPKPGWANADVVGTIQEGLSVPVAFDTDVNAAALGEYRWGAAQGLDTFLYITIGTGIGGGGLVNGKLMRGLIHPEMGHIFVPHDREADPYSGACPYHGDCLEGLAAGPAFEGRWGQRAGRLPPDHPAWPLEAQYLSYGLASLICTLSPQRIILGGGVMQQTHLFEMVRQKVQERLNGYIQAPEVLARIEEYIVPPGLGNLAGVLGSVALAQQIGS